MSTAAPVRPSGLAKWAGLGGIAYVVLFIVGVAISDSGAPDFDAPPAEVIKFYGDSGNRDQVAIGWLLIVLGVFCFLWFLSALRQLMSRVDAEGLLTTLATVGGAVYASLTLAGAGLQAGVLTMSDDTYRDQVYPGIIHAARDASYIMHVSGGAGAAAFVIAASLALQRARLLPGWGALLGVIIGVLQLVSVFFIPLILLAIWLAGVSIMLFASASGPREPLPGPD
jgi:hypothetical protein